MADKADKYEYYEQQNYLAYIGDKYTPGVKSEEYAYKDEKRRGGFDTETVDTQVLTQEEKFAAQVGKNLEKQVIDSRTDSSNENLKLRERVEILTESLEKILLYLREITGDKF